MQERGQVIHCEEVLQGPQGSMEPAEDIPALLMSREAAAQPCLADLPLLPPPAKYPIQISGVFPFFPESYFLLCASLTMVFMLVCTLPTS